MPKRIRDLTALIPAEGDFVAADKPAGATYKLPLGLANGVPILDASGALAAGSAYLDRGYLNSAIDWNTITTAGVYRVGENAFGPGSANTPPAVYRSGVLLVLVSGTTVQQIYIPHITDGGMYFRQTLDPTYVWGPWFTAGYRSGSNSNGYYIRFADGTQICWASHPDSSFGSVQVGEDANYRYRTKIWTFPATFTAAPAVLATGDISGARVDVITAYGANTTQCTLEAGQYNTSTVDVGAFYTFAIGRWR